MSRITRIFGFFGWGTAVGMLLLALAETWLHTDDFLYRYRSVFAAGRAMGKLLYVESRPPALLVLGDSRVDNDFDPRTLLEGGRGDITGFNFGMPGANAGILYGLVKRLANRGELGAFRVRTVLIGLDESMLQAEDSLGYGVFYSDPAWLWHNQEWRGMLAYGIRLWGFSANLKELREPGKAVEFMRASLADVEPIGGDAAEHLGYRAGFGGLQNAEQVNRQQEDFDKPPDPIQVAALFAAIALLRQYDVQVAVVYPPLLNRELLYLTPQLAAAKPYISIADRLAALDITQLSLEPGMQRDPRMFINPGHLNDRGAQHYSRVLAQQLRTLWPSLYSARQGA